MSRVGKVVVSSLSVQENSIGLWSSESREGVMVSSVVMGVKGKEVV